MADDLWTGERFVPVEELKALIRKYDENCVDITRCKECRYAYDEKVALVCGLINRTVRSDFYCADGKSERDW